MFTGQRSQLSYNVTGFVWRLVCVRWHFATTSASAANFFLLCESLDLGLETRLDLKSSGGRRLLMHGGLRLLMLDGLRMPRLNKVSGVAGASGVAAPIAGSNMRDTSDRATRCRKYFTNGTSLAGDGLSVR